MKNSLLLLAGLIALGSAKASIILPEPGKAISGTTTHPSLNPSFIKDCAEGKDEHRAKCVIYTSTGIALSISLAPLLKEEINQVTPDAYAYLAGEGMSLALEEVLDKFKNQNDGLDQLNNKEIVSIMISL